MPDTSKGTLLTAKAEDPATPQPENSAAEEKAPQPVLTAFLVIITEDGRVALDKDINTPIVPARRVSDDEALGALHVATTKLAITQSVNLTVGGTLANLPAALDSYGQQRQAEMQEAMLKQAVMNGQVPVPGQQPR